MVDIRKDANAQHFYPRPPRGGRRLGCRLRQRQDWISIHALREEGDCCTSLCIDFFVQFLSTPSARRATWAFSMAFFHAGNFYPRPPRGGRPFTLISTALYLSISIHALREEGDPSPFFMSVLSLSFLSTPSARRATAQCRQSRVVVCISIHALREEGDVLFGILSVGIPKFLSTPSARRATVCHVQIRMFL